MRSQASALLHAAARSSQYLRHTAAPAAAGGLATAKGFSSASSLRSEDARRFSTSAPAGKIVVSGAIAELDGDEMTRVIWQVAQALSKP